MSPDERQMLQDLFSRVAGTAGQARDASAQALIDDAVRAQPYAPYVLAQTVLVQQQALENALQRIKQLESANVAPAQGETSFLGNLGRSLFGSPAPRSAYDPAAGRTPSSPQAYSAPAGPWGQASRASLGGGFLSNALTTAAGVAGGMMLANELGSLFGGHSSGLFGGGGTTINNMYENPQGRVDQASQDAQQDADQDQDSAQDASDAGNDFGGGGDGGGFDV